MAKAFIAPGLALLGLFSTPVRLLLIGLAANILFVILVYLLHAGGRSFSDPLIVSAIVIYLLANYVQFGHMQAMKEGFGDLAGAVERLHDGNLERHAATTARGEMRAFVDRLEAVRESLAAMFSKVRTDSDEIGLQAGQISDGNENLSQRTQEQMATLEQTAASMEELSGTVKQNATNCQHADELARNADAVAHKGAEIVKRAVERMGMIEESSRRVVDVIAVIEGIAFQTNILALNAAVEAARAGDQGRGFAVVATEVRSLAQRSAEAAREIKALIEESAANVNEGGKLVGQAGTILDDIVKGVRDVTTRIGDVARASKEQSHGVEEINRAIAQMEGVTRQNADLVERAAQAALAFENAAQRLSQAVGRFRFG